MDERERYTYRNAGFNKFFNRSIKDSPTAETLRNSSRDNHRNMNYEDLSVDGSLGDTLRVGNVIINGRKGRLEFYTDDNQEFGRAGNLDD